MEVCQIPHFIFESTSQFSFKFCINLQCHQTQLLCAFFSSNFIYSDQRSQSKSKFLDFRVLESKFIKFLMSFKKWQVNSFSNFASFFIVMTHNSSVNFKLIHFLLWTKGSHQSPNFDTFKCSGENLQNSSCHFPSNKPIFLQILHHSSVSWKITPLYFFSSYNIHTLLKREALKWKFLSLSSVQVKICQTPHANFEMSSQFLFKFCFILHCHGS